MSLLKKAQQMEAMRFCLSRPEEVLGGEEVQAEVQPVDEGKDGDEEKADLNVADTLNACLSN